MRRAAATVLLIWLPLCVAVADIYRSVDAQGHVQYSDTPSPGAELVSAADAGGASTAGNDGASSAGTSRSGLLQQGDQISKQLATQAEARAVERETAEIRSKQCKQAQQLYQQSIQARRLYKVGPDGERSYLSDDEADQQRVKNRLAMDAACEGVSDQSTTGADDSASSGQTTGASSPPNP